MRRIACTCLAAASVLAVGLAVYGAAAKHSDKDMKVFVSGKEGWEQGPKSLPPGAQIAVLEGDPTQEGPFVMRLRLPDGYRIPPHTHPKTERLTVISGTFNIGVGDKFDTKAGQTMPAGSFGYWEAGMKHFVWATGETVVQLHGIGPWQINYLNPADDPRNKASQK